jgi:hypothetical protein
MIARYWHGVTPLGKSDAYLELMKTVALPNYKAIDGNLGAWCFRRIEGGVAHFEMVTLWTDMDAIGRFAGEEPERARYYDFDKDYLIEFEPFVRHAEAYAS